MTASHSTWLVGLMVTVLVILAIAGIGYRSLRRSSEPGLLVRKWILSAAILLLNAVVFGPLLNRDPAFSLLLLALGAMALGIIWAPTIGSILVNPISNLFMGKEDDTASPPLYSMAEAKLKMGKYREAIAVIEKELQKDPRHFPGQMMLAETFAIHLHDMDSAQMVIDKLLAQPGHAPRNIAFALNRLADWHCRTSQDQESAHRCLERIIQLLPDSEEAYYAEQRLARGENDGALHDPHRLRRIQITPMTQNIGLMEGFTGPKPPPENPDQEIAECQQRLAQYPHDNETREKLAILYARHRGRLDLAATEIENLVAQLGAPKKQVIHWLELLADLHLQCAEDLPAARLALERIIGLYPESALAETARKRLPLLAMELKARQSGGTVKLGTYETNLGLKASWPKWHPNHHPSVS